MTEYVSQALGKATNEAVVLLYAPGVDPFLEQLMKMLTVYSPLMKGR